MKSSLVYHLRHLRLIKFKETSANLLVKTGRSWYSDSRLLGSYWSNISGGLCQKQLQFPCTLTSVDCLRRRQDSSHLTAPLQGELPPSRQMPGLSWRRAVTSGMQQSEVRPSQDWGFTFLSSGTLSHHVKESDYTAGEATWREALAGGQYQPRDMWGIPAEMFQLQLALQKTTAVCASQPTPHGAELPSWAQSAT